MVAAAITLIAVAALSACQAGPERSRGDRRGQVESHVATASSGGSVLTCAPDSLRPAAAAPAEGLWVSDYATTRRRVAARIGPARADDGTLVVKRSVETMEVSAPSDTIRQRVDTATVALELVPPFSGETLGAARAADSTASPQSVATYAPSPRIRLAAYEPCVTSNRGPRIRYIRRDASGRIVTDVMLRRESDR